MTRHRVVVICNALDDATRIERGITTDSPAASRKVLQLCAALRQAGLRPCVLSLGRGRADGSAAYHPRRVRRVAGVPVIYAPFSRRRGWSELLSLLAPVGIARRLATPGHRALVFYNRQAAYLPTLVAAALFGYRRVLDLEDGEIDLAQRGWSRWRSAALRTVYDHLCSAGALLACSALSAMTRIRPVQCYYGIAAPSDDAARWHPGPVTAMLGGTLDPETGVDLLIEAVQQMRVRRQGWESQLRIEITGKGSSLAALTALAASDLPPQVVVHGRLTDREYRAVVARCDVGMALKPNGGALAHTTFPSKVVEMASAGMLVLSTDISDVRAVLGDGALYLQQDDPAALVAHLQRIVEHRSAARRMAQAGQAAVLARCAPGPAGRAVGQFIFGLNP